RRAAHGPGDTEVRLIRDLGIAEQLALVVLRARIDRLDVGVVRAGRRRADVLRVEVLQVPRLSAFEGGEGAQRQGVLDREVTELAVEVPLRLARLALLRRDDHHPGRGLRAVDRRRGGTLQDFDRLNVLGVDVGDAVDAVVFHAWRPGCRR